MINIVIYKTSNGDITRCVTCPAEMADLQVEDGEAWLEHDRVDDTLYKVDLQTMEIVPIN